MHGGAGNPRLKYPISEGLSPHARGSLPGERAGREL